MLAQGNTVGADQMLTEALGFRPDNQRAREALARIASSGRRDAFIEAGDTAAERREYVTAETQYKNALELGVDDELTAKMTAVRIQILLEQSREALQDGRIDEANELVNQAQQLGSDNPDVAAVLREVGVRGEYIRHLTAGDAARARSSFGEAKRHYLRAKEAMDTPQVRARLDDTEFDHLLAQARDFIAAKEYTSAKAQLQIAASIRTTDEVRALFDQVNAAEAGASPSNP
jgi:tetratricopeptide (TPR) repeat protein